MNPTASALPQTTHSSNQLLLPLAMIACLVGMVEPMPLAMTRLLLEVFDTSVEGVWSLSASYNLAFALALPLMGYCCDRVQRRMLLLPALVMLAASTLAMACTSYLGLAIASRVMAGIAAAAILPALLAIVADQLAPAKRVAAFGLVVLGLTLGSKLGPMLTGMLAQPLGWRGPLVLLSAACLGAMLLAARGVPQEPAQQPAAATAGVSGRWLWVRPLLAMAAWHGLGALGLMVSGQLLMADMDFTAQQASKMAWAYVLGMALGNLAAGWVRRRLGRDEDQVLLAVLLLALSVVAFVLLPRTFLVGLLCLGAWGLALGLAVPAGLAVLVGRAGAGTGKVLGWSLMFNALAVAVGLPLAISLLMSVGPALLGAALVAGVGFGLCLAARDWFVTR
ncbi:MFS transporter [Pseudomonas fakonensis]|uniref:MFS transporter n=1 Tax=Pseudomonas fakonensis TaxID=2842355 RepID=A0ABX8N0F3_9PSED|nr:MFS transporter [Pseudomonas fakonensis]QXH49835.1 MFS transporter [Pseudomonas fakonensis]